MIVEIYPQSVNSGKGAAIRLGIMGKAKGHFVVIQDADLEYDPQDYRKLIEPLEQGTAQVVFGSRYMQRPKAAGAFLFRAGVQLINWSVRLLYGIRLTDEATCYKAMATSLLKSLDLQCERFEFCPEVTAKLCRLGIGILEVPISYHARPKSEGKKIRLHDGIEALQTLWRWRKWAPPRQSPVASLYARPASAGMSQCLAWLRSPRPTSSLPMSFCFEVSGAFVRKGERDSRLESRSPVCSRSRNIRRRSELLRIPLRRPSQLYVLSRHRQDHHFAGDAGQEFFEDAHVEGRSRIAFRMELRPQGEPAVVAGAFDRSQRPRRGHRAVTWKPGATSSTAMWCKLLTRISPSP